MRSIKIFFLLLSGFSVLGQGGDDLAIAQVTRPSIVAQRQTDEIDRALSEGFRLFQEGSKESLVGAIKELEKALDLSLIAQSPMRQSASLLALGRVSDLLGRKLKAVEYYEQSLPLYRAARDKMGEAATLNNIGLVYDTLGNPQKALTFYNSALILLEAENSADKQQETKILNNIGQAYSDLGNQGKALEFHHRTMALWKGKVDEKSKATTLSNLGLVYSRLGDKGKALEFYNKALPLRRAVRDHDGEAATLHNIGAVYAALGEKQKALQFYGQALPLRRIVSDHNGEAQTLNNMGLIYADLGERQKALRFYDQAMLLLHLIGNSNGRATIFNNVGSIYNDLGEKQKALKFHSQALLGYRAASDRNGEAVTLNNIGYLLQQQNQFNGSIAFYKQAVNVYETLRTDITSLSRTEQSTYTQTVASTYKLLADLLTQQGRLAEAQQVIELLKIRELKELKSNKSESKTVLQQLSISESEKQMIAKINPEAAKEVQAQSLPMLDRLSPTNPLNQSAQTLLSNQPNSALIYQLFTKDKLWIILVTPDGKLQRFASTANQATIESLAAQFRQQIEQCEKINYTCDKSDTQSLNQTSQKLYEQLFPTDLQTALKTANPQHLTFALDGSLRNIPIAALHTGTQYLVEQYTLSSIIAAQLTDSQDKLPANSAQSPVLAVGTSKAATIWVPDYVSADRQDQYRGLSNVPIELNAVTSSTAKSPGAFPGHQLLDDQFTLPNLRQQLPQHRLFHIGSHAIFRPNFLDYSYILMGNNQPWSIAQMDSEANGKLFQNIHMVTLSACQSGLGGRDKNGMEIAGMSHAFLSQGAKTITASLWQVDDASTAMLMQNFYQNLAQKPAQSKAASLNQAQIYLLKTPRSTLIAQLQRSVGFKISDLPNSTAQSQPIAKIADYTHPYYWAAFTLIGNSR